MPNQLEAGCESQVRCPRNAVAISMVVVSSRGLALGLDLDVGSRFDRRSTNSQLVLCSAGVHDGTL